MSGQEIIPISVLKEVKKAIDFWMEGFYNESEFYSHILSIIRADHQAAQVEKSRLEKFIHRTETMALQFNSFYKSKDQKTLLKCKEQTEVVEKAIQWLKVNGYSTDRFKNPNDQQQQLPLIDGKTK